jgi:hypothetical protein
VSCAGSCPLTRRIRLRIDLCHDQCPIREKTLPTPTYKYSAGGYGSGTAGRFLCGEVVTEVGPWFTRGLNKKNRKTTLYRFDLLIPAQQRRLGGPGRPVRRRIWCIRTGAPFPFLLHFNTAFQSIGRRPRPFLGPCLFTFSLFALCYQIHQYQHTPRLQSARHETTMWPCPAPTARLVCRPIACRDQIFRLIEGGIKVGPVPLRRCDVENPQKNSDSLFLDVSAHHNTPRSFEKKGRFTPTYRLAEVRLLL